MGVVLNMGQPPKVLRSCWGGAGKGCAWTSKMAYSLFGDIGPLFWGLLEVQVEPGTVIYGDHGILAFEAEGLGFLNQGFQVACCGMTGCGA